MVEVGIIGNDLDLKKQAEKTLEKLVSDYSFSERGELVYRGHPAMYCDSVARTLLKVQEENGLDENELLRRKPHWHRDFRVIIAENLEDHDIKFAEQIYRRLVEHTSNQREVIYVTPVGPMGHYPELAKLMKLNGKKDGLNSKLIFPFAMDEWSDSFGNSVSKKSFPYMTSFREDMAEQFYDLLKDSDLEIPEKNKNFAAEENLRNYERKMKKLLDRNSGVVFTGGVGMIGHIMFWEPTFGKLFGKELSEKISYIRGAPLTTETLAQNRFTSAASAPVPSYANTIGLGLSCMLREYGLETGRINAFFGLDNVEPLIWQRYITRAMLSMENTDPSFGATYPATVPGAYIIVKNHLASEGFKVPSK